MKKNLQSMFNTSKDSSMVVWKRKKLGETKNKYEVTRWDSYDYTTLNVILVFGQDVTFKVCLLLI